MHAALSIRLTPGESAITDTRKTVRERLRSWAVPPLVAQDVALTTHELVTNAWLHGDPPIDLHIVNTGSEVVVEVRDRSPRRPRPRRTDIGDEHGRGLQLVQAFADDWGTRLGSGTKTVWCSHLISP